MLICCYINLRHSVDQASQVFSVLYVDLLLHQSQQMVLHLQITYICLPWEVLQFIPHPLKHMLFEVEVMATLTLLCTTT